MDHLNVPAVEEGVDADEECVGPLTRKCCEGSVDFAAGAGIEDLDLQSDAVSCCRHLSRRGLRIHSIGRIDENGHASCRWHQLMQERQPLCGQLTGEKIDTC